MRGLLGLGVVVCALVAVGCGDAPICASEVFVAIQTSQIVTDVDAVAMGVQTDVNVRTSAREGELVTLAVSGRPESGQAELILSGPCATRVSSSDRSG
ncbi:MAG: hypothetical protein KF773_01665 [Deltaproteobacteria bacterium]|nr:hypothetical protein [Deltaproteobacteria bacterium]